VFLFFFCIFLSKDSSRYFVQIKLH